MRDAARLEAQPQSHPVLSRLRRCCAPLHPGDLQMVTLALLMKVTILTFGAKTFQVLQNQRPNPTHLLDLWNRLDSLHYQTLAKTGYVPKSLTLAFYRCFRG